MLLLLVLLVASSSRSRHEELVDAASVGMSMLRASLVKRIVVTIYIAQASRVSRLLVVVLARDRVLDRRNLAVPLLAISAERHGRGSRRGWRDVTLRNSEAMECVAIVEGRVYSGVE